MFWFSLWGLSCLKTAEGGEKISVTLHKCCFETLRISNLFLHLITLVYCQDKETVGKDEIWFDFEFNGSEKVLQRLLEKNSV
jgi:hypothetical protein